MTVTKANATGELTDQPITEDHPPVLNQPAPSQQDSYRETASVALYSRHPMESFFPSRKAMLKKHNSRMHNEKNGIGRNKSHGKQCEGGHALSISNYIKWFQWDAEKSTGLVGVGKQRGLLGKHFADLES